MMKMAGSHALALLIGAQIVLCMAGVASVMLRERPAVGMTASVELSEPAGLPDQARS